MYIYYTSCIYKNTKTNLSFHEASPILGHTAAPKKGFRIPRLPAQLHVLLGVVGLENHQAASNI